jgi:DNA-binding CsgD family transcriptional regulator
MDEFRRQRPSGVAALNDDEPADDALTDGEEKVLALVAKGKSNKDIAEAVFLAEGTVKNYVSKIMENCMSRHALNLPSRRSSGKNSDPYSTTYGRRCDDYTRRLILSCCYAPSRA